ncbi:amino acid ABC transporter permease [Aurantimonas sp. A2-1-M11]|uniref:amino acid ABC transporter permease n=1 Tax=Aurantimonas sp. A2-1-M11 TaxID=3113712 RepID=UPI002F944D37
MGYQLNFDAVWRSFDDLLWGLALSLQMAVLAIAIGCLIGLVVAFALVSKLRVVRWPARVYVTILRNTPILILILFAYFALPQVGVTLGKVESFIATLAIYSGAYLAEVFRSGLVAIPVGQEEAGLAIGLRRSQIRVYVILPLMFRNALPALGNTVISLFKDTSLAAVISVPELTYEARKINVETFRVVETWIVAAGIYVLTCTLMGAILRFVERRMAIPR